MTIKGGKQRIGAVTANPEWSTPEDEDVFEEMYPRMRPGLVLAQVNGEDVIYLDFDSIMTMVEEADQPRHFMFIMRESKWNIVRRKLHFIATKMRKQGDGVSKAEREWRLQVHMNILHYCATGNLKEFNFWMARVSDMDFVDATGSTALHYAASSGNKDIVENLLKRNVDMFIGDKEGRTCLHAAVRRGHEKITQLLLNAKPSLAGDLVNVPDHQNRRAIHEAAIGGNMHLMHRLLRAGALFDVPESTWSFLPIHFAASNGHVEMVKWLIEYGGQSLHAETFCQKEPLELSDGGGWDQVTELLQHQIKGEPIHCVLTRARYPWMAQGDSAMSPKAKRRRDRLKKARGGGGKKEEQLYDRDGKPIMIEIQKCERVYLGTWQCLNKWWLNSRGITAVVTLFDIDKFGERTVKQRGKRSKVSAATARAVRFAFHSLKEWKTEGEQRRMVVDPEGSDSDSGRGSDSDSGNGSGSGSASEYYDDESVYSESDGVSVYSREGKEGNVSDQGKRRQVYHISVPNSYKKKSDCSKLLSSFPSFGRVFDPLVSSGDFPRVLVVGYDWQSGAAAIASWMMTRRGMERENKGLPFFRCEESLRILRDSLPPGAVPEGKIDGVLLRLQQGLDRRRQMKLNARVADLFKVI